MNTPSFHELPYQRPTREDLNARAANLQARWDSATTAAEQVAIIRDFDRGERTWETMRAIAAIHFTQDTRNPDYKAEKSYFDEIGPEAREHAINLLRRVVASPHRSALEDAFGAQALALWELSIKTFEPAIADHKRRESDLLNQYDELLASIQVEFQGKKCNLPTLRAFFGHADRKTREDALRLQGTALAAHQERLDAIFDDLVKLRHSMATTLGYPSYTPLAYANLGRTDYGPDDVAAFRAQVRDVILPIARRIHARRAQELGIERYNFQDEGVRDTLGSPRPAGDHDWMLERAAEMFDAMGDDFSAFFALMRDKGLMDLKSREGKIGGGYCEALVDYKVPFIFANFNGTQSDVNVFTHECGHAFQGWSSRDQPLRDYLWPTLEACEIHSMGLEFLTFPHMELFFQSDAERFRIGHVEDALLFLPYGVAVDEFQHWIYANPTATPDERAAAWREVEQRWLSHRVYEDMPYYASGRIWQRQGHIFQVPFYYIDYCLAQVCAFQLWQRAEQDRDATMALYRTLCGLGGSLPFTRLLQKVGLANPFQPGSLESVAAHVERSLHING